MNQGFEDPLPALDDSYRREKPRPKPETIWASEVGHQPRRFLFERAKHYPTTTAAQDARRLEMGNQRADELRRRLVRYGFRGSLPAFSRDEQLLSFPLDAGAWVVSGRPDGLLQGIEWRHEQWKDLLLEIKGMANYSFRRHVEGVTAYETLAQVQILMKLTDLFACYLLVENRDTGELHGSVIERDGHFLGTLLSDLTRTTAKIEMGFDPLQERACEGEGFGTKEKTVKLSITAGRKLQVLDWRCAYCPFARYCFPHHVRVQTKNKPEWIHEAVCPPGTDVLEIGADVMPLTTWKLLDAHLPGS